MPIEPRATSKGLVSNKTKITYAIGKEAADKAEYDIWFEPVAQYNITYATGTTGTITINDGSPQVATITGTRKAIGFVNTYFTPVKDTVIKATVGSPTIRMTYKDAEGDDISVDPAAFKATSQVYTVTVEAPLNFNLLFFVDGTPTFTVPATVNAQNIIEVSLEASTSVQWILNGAAPVTADKFVIDISKCIIGDNVLRVVNGNYSRNYIFKVTF